MESSTVTWADGSFVNTDTWTGSSVPGAQVGTCTLAATGNPNDAYAVRLEILRAGATLASGTVSGSCVTMAIPYRFARDRLRERYSRVPTPTTCRSPRGSNGSSR